MLIIGQYDYIKLIIEKSFKVFLPSGFTKEKKSIIHHYICYIGQPAHEIEKV